LQTGWLMRHGRDHQEREQKYRRANHTAERIDFESELRGARRSHGFPRQRVFGANQGRFAPASELDESEPVGEGSEVAPTARAAAREAARHDAERKLGRLAAGLGENLRDRREPEVTRGSLEQAARAADLKVTSSQ
jgi:hypothetical protein